MKQMMMTLIAGMMILLAPLAQAAEPQAVKVLQKWSGKKSNNAGRELAPPDVFVVDKDRFAKIWKAWRAGEALPPIDFKTQMALVFVTDGPNHVGCEPTHDGKGNVEAIAMSTLIGGDGFGYLILIVSREGVKTVNGKPLPGEKAAARVVADAAVDPPAQAVPGVAPGLAAGEGVIGMAGAADEPIRKLENVAVKPEAFNASSATKPLELKSEKEAAECFTNAELAKLTRQVKFDKQILLVFAWRGSGGDRLSFAVAESFPEQVGFTYTRGKTKDLREHVQVYVVRANVKWSVK